MGIVTRIKEGDRLRLNYQFVDGEVSLPLKVKAILRDENGEELDQSGLFLTHVGGGLFKDNSLIKGSEPEITVQYIVFEDDGTTLAGFEIDVDIYLLEDFSKLISTFIPSIDVIVEDSG